MELIKAEKEDSSDIISLVGEVWREYECTLNLDIEEQHLLDPGNYFRQRGGEFWIVRENGILIATAAVSIENELAEMKTLYVKEESRGRGLGTQLTNLAIETAKERGAKRMELWSDTRFIDAHRMYERLGFVQFGVRDLNDHNNTHEYGYRRDI